MEKLAGILASQNPVIQGLVLSSITAIWLVDHQPELREKMLTAYIENVRAFMAYELKASRTS
jgi:hypothetical protein